MKLWILSWALALVALCAACAALQSPAIAPDVAKELACVQTQAEAGVTDPVAIALSCGMAEAQLAYDYLVALLSGDWGKAHPALAPPLRESVKRYGALHGGHS